MPRIMYDDREDFPWLIIYGPRDKPILWGRFATREIAEEVLLGLKNFYYTVAACEGIT